MILAWVMALPLNLISQIADEYDVDKHLIAAFVSVESHGEICATRFESHYRWLVDPEKHAKNNSITVETEANQQKTSWGLMQVMGAVARELGLKHSIVQLCDAKTGLRYGTKFVKQLITKYGLLDDAISAYNQGSPRKNSMGEYYNQSYVDEILKRYHYLKNK